MVWGKNGTSDTLTSASDELTIADLTECKSNMLLSHQIYSGVGQGDLNFNNDKAGNDYATRSSKNGATDSEETSANRLIYMADNGTNTTDFEISYLCDIDSKEKLIIGFFINSNSTGSNAPIRREMVGKYDETASRITRIDIDNVGGGDFDTGSNLSVLGSEITPAAAIPFAENAQVGSRAEITDSRKMYNLSDVSTSELKAYYKFDESSGNIINQATSVGSSDSLGSNADMTISGATYSQTGKIGNALSFDGSNDYGTLGSSLSQWNFFHGTGDWSINFWVNYDEFVGEDRFFSNMDSTETRGINFGVGWSGNPDGQIGLSIKSDNGFMTNNGGINFPSDISGTGTWVMITLVADYSDTTNTYTVYLNGVAGSSVARAVAGSTGDSEYSLKLASRGNYANKFFDGLFDEMTIWQRVLTADEITSLYNSNSGRAISSGMFTEWQEIGA